MKTFHILILHTCIILCWSTKAELLLSPSCEENDIELGQGRLEGKTGLSVLTANSYCNFKSIPFAKMKNAEIIETNVEHNQCNENLDAIRKVRVDQKVKIRKNCLFLNIYTPEPPSLIEIPKRVIMLSCHERFTPSRYFQSIFSPDYLMTHDVVVVTFNCFSSSDNSRLTENVHQSLALKWLENNIKSFGGDVENVIIFGNGSRTSSINYHIFSPFSKGIFQNCILKSTKNMWKTTRLPRGAKYSFGKLLLHAGSGDSVEFANYLNNLMVNSIASNTLDVVLLKAKGLEPYFYYPITTQGDEGTATLMPVICPQEEEEYAILLELVALPLVIDMINNRLPDVIRTNLIDIDLGENNTIEKISDDVREYYFHNGVVNESYFFLIVDFYTDLVFTKYVHQSIAYSVELKSIRNAFIDASRDEVVSYVKFTLATSIPRPLDKIADEEVVSLTPTSSCSNHIVTLNQGKLIGIGNRSILTGKEYCSYLKIPYAKAPLGDLRFQAPLQHEGWTGVYEAVNEGPLCIQKDHYGLRGEEDCLFLNVFTPECPCEMNSSKAVMVYIHPGAFRGGSASLATASPDFLINNDVIVVTLQHRIDVLGFFDLDIPECSGNVGMKDQVLALKWVQTNIKSFGGDPDRVTIFGISSGATSVNMHMVSPLSKGLFARCIMQSGNAITPSVFASDQDEIIEELANELNYNKRPIDKFEFLKYLKIINASGLINASDNVTFKLFRKYPGKTLPMTFSPSIENIKQGAFLPDDPIKLSKTADPVPVIIGFAEKEYTWLLRYFSKSITLYDAINNHLVKVLEENLIDLNLDKKSLIQVAKKVKEFYFHNKTVDDLSFLDIVNLYSDLRYVRAGYKSIQHIYNSSSPVYVYRFSFVGYLSLSSYVINVLQRTILERKITLQYGGHTDDNGYLFYLDMVSIFAIFFNKQPEITVINTMCKLWTNFAKYGNPNGDNLNFSWTPSTIMNPRHLVIDSEFHEEYGRAFEERFKFWDEIENIRQN